MHERLLDQIGFTRNVKDSFAVEKKVIFFLDRVESSEKHEFWHSKFICLFLIS